ncbi:MAG: GIY-YIG nuclease family protein [bacterium]|nr:GIY-YIG nuclease family protein [bacterium]
MSMHLFVTSLRSVSRRVLTGTGPYSKSKKIRGKPGIYILKNNRGRDVYYVGRAVDLHRRLVDHTKDRHAKKWTTFDAFVMTTRDDEQLQDIEALILALLITPGNREPGRYVDYIGASFEDLACTDCRFFEEDLTGKLKNKPHPDKTDLIADTLVRSAPIRQGVHPEASGKVLAHRFLELELAVETQLLAQGEAKVADEFKMFLQAVNGRWYCRYLEAHKARLR